MTVAVVAACDAPPFQPLIGGNDATKCDATKLPTSLNDFKICQLFFTMFLRMTRRVRRPKDDGVTPQTTLPDLPFSLSEQSFKSDLNANEHHEKDRYGNQS